METPPEYSSPKDVDQARRVSAQVALAIGEVGVEDIGSLDVNPLPSGRSLLRAVVVREISPAQTTSIIGGWPLIANAERAARWSKSIRDEYRRQYNPMPTGSFAPMPTVHPDQVDLWALEAAGVFPHEGPSSDEAGPDIEDEHAVTFMQFADVSAGMYARCSCDGWEFSLILAHLSGVNAAYAAHLAEVSGR